MFIAVKALHDRSSVGAQCVVAQALQSHSAPLELTKIDETGFYKHFVPTGLLPFWVRKTKVLLIQFGISFISHFRPLRISSAIQRRQFS